MKVWLIAVGGLVIFILVTIIVQHQIQTTTEQLGQYIARADVALDQRNWPEGQKEIKSLKSSWRKTKAVWTLFLHHFEIDSIDQALTRTLRAIKSRDYAETQIELGDLKQLLEHIPELEKVSWVNVL
jgi:hypothetical protein